MRFTCHRGGGTGQKRAVFFFERHRCDVGLIDDRVDDRVMPQRKARRDFIHVFAHQEADSEDQIVFFVGQHGEIRLIIGGRFRLQNCDVGV